MRINQIIDKIVEETPYDYRDPCGANNCECYENSIKIDTIIKVFQERIEKLEAMVEDKKAKE
jgi:hypothetical protein